MSPTVIKIGPMARIWAPDGFATGAFSCDRTGASETRQSPAPTRIVRKVLRSILNSCKRNWIRGALCAGGNSESLFQVVSDAQRIGDDGQRRVHGGTRGEEAAVHDVEIVHIMRFAVHIEGRGFQVAAKTNGAVLMGNSGEGNLVSEEQVPRKQALVAL